MNKVFKLFLVATFLSFPHWGYSQEIDVVLSDDEPKYELIVDVEVSSPVYVEKPVSDYEAGYRYRIIITRARIFESLYIEKQILNTEGGIYKTEWTKKVDMFDLIDKLGISSEQMVFKDPIWLDVSTFEIYLSNKKLKMIINSGDSISSEIID